MDYWPEVALFLMLVSVIGGAFVRRDNWKEWAVVFVLMVLVMVAVAMGSAAAHVLLRFYP